MESSQTYFCHTCKTDLNLAYLLNKDEEPTCSKCGEFFIEMLESTEQLTALKALYPVSQSVPSNANGPSLVS